MPLGRSLIEDVDDDLDEIPSYSPKRSAPAETASAKAPPVKREPLKPKAAQAEKPAARAPVKPRPAAVEKPAPRVMETIKVIEKPKPAPKPPLEDDGFGSGLDE